MLVPGHVRRGHRYPTSHIRITVGYHGKKGVGSDPLLTMILNGRCRRPPTAVTPGAHAASEHAAKTGTPLPQPRSPRAGNPSHARARRPSATRRLVPPGLAAGSFSRVAHVTGTTTGARAHYRALPALGQPRIIVCGYLFVRDSPRGEGVNSSRKGIPARYAAIGYSVGRAAWHVCGPACAVGMRGSGGRVRDAGSGMRGSGMRGVGA
jgi:hypothetical protein